MSTVIVGTPEQDLERHLADRASTEARERKLLLIQEEWDFVTFHDPNENEWCYLVFQRPSLKEAPYAKRVTVAFDRGYATEDEADTAMQRAMDDEAERRVGE